MNYLHYFLFSFSFLMFSNSSLHAQNQDSVRAYILEFIKPEASFSLYYGSGSMSLEYIEQDPLTPATEATIASMMEEYERTNDPIHLYTIGQTYVRMNRRSESTEWVERSLNEVEFLMEKYPDSIELVETAFLIYFDAGQADIASLAAKMISDHYNSSETLFAEALSYTFTGEYDKGIATSIQGLMRYPGEAKWYLARIIHEFTKKIQLYDIESDEFSAPENRIDRSFLNDGLTKYPDSLEVELAAILGNFFLFSYEEVIPKFLEELSDKIEVEGFEFNLESALEEKVDIYLKKLIKLSKRKEFKNCHAVHYSIGVAQMFKSEPQKAILNFEKAIELMEPKYRSGQDNVYMYYDNLITCYRILGDTASAEKKVIARATEEINLDPVPLYRIEMALFRAMNNDFKSASSILDQTIAMDSTAIDAYTYKALFAMLSNDKGEAERYLRATQSLNPNDVTAFKSIILFNILDGSIVDAKEQINQLEAYDPTDLFIEDARRLLLTE